MLIRPFTPADVPHLEELLGQIWGSEPGAREYYRFGPDSPPDSPRFFRTLVAEEDGATIGFGSAWINGFHPHALYVSVNMHPAWRGRGAGTRLLEALDALNSTRLPLQACTWATSAAGVRFLERHGFQLVRRTYEPVLHIADVDRDAFRSFGDRCADHGYTLASLADLMQEPHHQEKLALLLCEVFTATHGINPPRPMDLHGWIDVLRNDPPSEVGSYVALHGVEYIAMSTVHQDEPDRLSLGWRGVAKAHRHNERDLILALTLAHISHAAGHGAEILAGEFDTTDPWAMMQLGAFPFRPAPCWLTFQRLLIKPL
jgi:GNAT superfamily N-acetyltransferase